MKQKPSLLHPPDVLTTSGPCGEFLVFAYWVYDYSIRWGSDRDPLPELMMSLSSARAIAHLSRTIRSRSRPVASWFLAVQVGMDFTLCRRN